MALEEDFNVREFFDRAKENLLEYIPNPPKRWYISDKPSLVLEFSSEADFFAMYDKDYQIYSFLYENILQNDLEFNPEIFRTHRVKQPIIDPNTPNYLVLRYRSNYLAPMKRNYGLTFKVNEIIGSQISIEEVQDGFIRFVKTKRDYQSMFLGNDAKEKWIKFFQLYEIDIEHPTIQEFIRIIDSYFQTKN